MANNYSYIDTSEVTKNLTALMVEMPIIAEELLKKVASSIVQEAKNQCPVGDTGLLQASINCEADGPLSIIIYADRVYAAAQHENLEYHHDKGKAKYIEDPLMTIGLGDMPRTIAENLLRNISGGLNG